MPAHFAAVEAAWHARANALDWGPAHLEQLLVSAVLAVATAGYVVEDIHWRVGIRQVTSQMVGFDEWLDGLLDTASRHTEPSPASVEQLEDFVNRRLRQRG